MNVSLIFSLSASGYSELVSTERGKNIQNSWLKGKHAGGAHMQCINLSRPASSPSPFPHILKRLPVSLYKGSSKMKCGWLTHLEKEDKHHHRALHKEHLTCWGPIDTTEGSASVPLPIFQWIGANHLLPNTVFLSPILNRENSLCLKGTTHLVVWLWKQS